MREQPTYADTTLRAVPAGRRRAVSGHQRGMYGTQTLQGGGITEPCTIMSGQPCTIQQNRRDNPDEGPWRRVATSDHAKLTRQRHREPLFSGDATAIAGREAGTGQTQTALS